MYTMAPPTLMRALTTRDDLVSLWSHDRPVAKAQRSKWWRIGRTVTMRRPDCAEPYGANVGLFILGYGQVPGTQESAARLF